MSAKQKKRAVVYFVILGVIMAMMAASTIVDFVNGGSDAVDIIDFLPFLGIGIVFNAAFSIGKKSDDK